MKKKFTDMLKKLTRPLKGPAKKKPEKKEQKTQEKPSAPKKTSTPIAKEIKKTEEKTKKESEIKSESFKAVLEKGQRSGALTHEELIEFSRRYQFTEKDITELLRLLEKEGVQLILQDETDSSLSLDYVKDDESDKASKPKFKSIDFEAETEEEEEQDDEDEENKQIIIRETASTAQLTDGVKDYLSEIGKIPL